LALSPQGRRRLTRRRSYWRQRKGFGQTLAGRGQFAVDFVGITGRFLTSDPETTRLIHQSLLGDAWENARQAVVVFDDARNFVAFNAAYCELMGYSREELLELGSGGHLAADDESRDEFDRVLHHDVDAVGSSRVQRKDGSIITVRYRLVETNVSALPYTIALVWPEDRRKL
jgi:PAS domain S-box-containing protein